jgi:hypothetical protein
MQLKIRKLSRIRGRDGGRGVDEELGRYEAESTRIKSDNVLLL